MKTKLKKGDVVELDCGYDGMDNTKSCRLLEDPHETMPLFSNSPVSVCAQVEIIGTGETFCAVLN